MEHYEEHYISLCFSNDTILKTFKLQNTSPLCSSCTFSVGSMHEITIKTSKHFQFWLLEIFYFLITEVLPNQFKPLITDNDHSKIELTKCCHTYLEMLVLKVNELHCGNFIHLYHIFNLSGHLPIHFSLYLSPLSLSFFICLCLSSSLSECVWVCICECIRHHNWLHMFK